MALATFFFIFAILLWVGGYINTVFFMTPTAVALSDSEIMVFPPKWLYYLCGAPVSKKYPKGTMMLFAFRGQMIGLFWGVFLTWASLTKAPKIEFSVFFVLSTLLANALADYVSKQYTSTSQSAIRKKRK